MHTQHREMKEKNDIQYSEISSGILFAATLRFIYVVDDFVVVLPVSMRSYASYLISNTPILSTFSLIVRRAFWLFSPFFFAFKCF